MIDYAYNQFATERFKLPNEDQVLSLEQRFGVQLPADFREEYDQLNFRHAEMHLSFIVLLGCLIRNQTKNAIHR
jgi:hypothetical protein